MFFYLVMQLIGGALIAIAILWLLKKSMHGGHIFKFTGKIKIPLLILIVGIGLFVFGDKTHAPSFALPPWMQTYSVNHKEPFLPLKNIAAFFKSFDNFEDLEDIGADPNDVPPPITRDNSEVVKIELETREVLSEVAPEVYFNFWTYNSQVPGPMLRVREGDMVEVTIKNHESSLHSHNIDLHAVNGPGGGATLSNVKPGETKIFRWNALAPGIYVYHCATANVSTHNAHGQYGLILVEPKEGMAEVDKEFYVMQGEIYTEGPLGKKGLTVFDSQALLDGIPNYITFNGHVEDAPRMKVEAGDKVRMYVGNGGVNLISSFHIIGEIFDDVYIEGALSSEPLQDIQTTAVLPGGATIVEFVAEVPGNLILVDHALARMNKGAWAIMEVEGEPNLDVYTPIDPNSTEEERCGVHSWTWDEESETCSP